MTMSLCAPVLLVLVVLTTAWSYPLLPDNATVEVGPSDVWTKKQVVREVRKLSDETTSMTKEATRLGSRVVQLTKRLDSLHGKHRAAGTVYVRWGSKSCPDTSEMVYSGVVGGGNYLHSGSAVNALCLTLDPVYDGHPKTTYITYLYGAEYEQLPEPIHNLDIVCAKCLSPRAVTMIPGTNTCLPGWTKEYSGYLMAGYPTHPAATEYLCMDAAREVDRKSHENHDGKLLYYVLGQCGSLPCPPYQHDQVVTCVVCSK